MARPALLVGSYKQESDHALIEQLSTPVATNVSLSDVYTRSIRLDDRSVICVGSLTSWAS